MTRAIDDLTEAEIREAIALRGKRRIGNRLQLAIARWRRVGQQLELLRFRQRWARKFSEYECVGGPHDGQIRNCWQTNVVPVPGGYYSFDHTDCRLHFHARPAEAWAKHWSGQ